jgi:hypothetical protein
LRIAALLLWLVAAVWVQLIRSSGTPVWDAFWAEDGRFFYGQARERSLWHLWHVELGGYLQVAPRLLASIAAKFPVQDAAFATAFLAALTCALLSVYVYAATDGVLRRRWQRCAIAALLVLNPAAAYEVNATFNNLHWFLMVAAFWACWSRATRRPRVALDVAVVVLAALSDPLTGLLLPLVGWRAWRGSRVARWITAGLVAALALQYWLGVAGNTPHQNGPRGFAHMPEVYGLRVAGSFLVGESNLRSWWGSHGAWTAYAALLLVAVGMALAVSFARDRERRLLAVLLTYSVAFLIAPLTTRGGAVIYLRHPFTLNGSRYTVIPLWLLYSALIVAVGLPWRLPRAVRGWPLPSLAIVLIGSQLVANFAPAGARTSGGSWREGLKVARAGCAAHETGFLPGPFLGQARPSIVRGTVFIPVSPYGNYFWSVRLHCSDLS